MPTIVICAFSLIAWHPALSGTFHYDDEHSVVANYHIRTLDSPWRFLLDRGQFSVDHDKTMHRPLVVLSLALDYALSGSSPVAYMATNLAAHIGTALAVWWLAGLLGASPTGALLAGVLFAVHPVCSEPVNYVSARSESMAVGFGLWGVGLWVRRMPRP